MGKRLSQAVDKEEEYLEISMDSLKPEHFN